VAAVVMVVIIRAPIARFARENADSIMPMPWGAAACAKGVEVNDMRGAVYPSAPGVRQARGGPGVACRCAGGGECVACTTRIAMHLIAVRANESGTCGQKRFKNPFFTAV